MSVINPSRERAIRVFREHDGVLRTKDALGLGIHRRTLYAMRDDGEVERIARGLYRLAELPPLTEPDLATVALRAPDAVLCLVSALAFHDITTEIPHAVYVALQRGAKRPRVRDVPVRAFWFSEAAFEAGIETHTVDGIEVRVYAAAKSVADAFKYRNKLGLDVAVDALKLYLARSRGLTAELTKYARICRVERVMRPYLEALL